MHPVRCRTLGRFVSRRGVTCLVIVEDGPGDGPGLALGYRVDEAGLVGRVEDWALNRLRTVLEEAREGGRLDDALLKRVWTAGSGYADVSRAWARRWFRPDIIQVPGDLGSGGGSAAEAQGRSPSSSSSSSMEQRPVAAGEVQVRGVGRVKPRVGTRIVRRRRRAVSTKEDGEEDVPGGQRGGG